MNVDSIQVSEYATRRGGGLLTVVNAFNRIQLPRPSPLPSLACSLVIHGASAEAGTTHTGEIRLLNEDRESVLDPANFEWTFSAASDRGIPLRHVHVHRIVGYQFEKEGPYAFEVYIDGTYHAAASFYVEFTG